MEYLIIPENSLFSATYFGCTCVQCKQCMSCWGCEQGNTITPDALNE